MNKKSLTFKITSITLLTLDILALLFFVVTFSLILAKTNIFQMYHLIVFLIFAVINFAYIVYLSVILILNKNTKPKS